MDWRKSDIDTPALLLDLDALQRNIRRMAGFFAQRSASLRPHCKTHKCVRIAQMQIDAGAPGITCQKLGEAEVMVNGGIRDVLITNQIVGRVKIERLVNLCRRAMITVIVDSAENVRTLSGAATAAGTEIGVLVEVDVGMHRCGVSPGKEAVALAQRVADSDGLTLRGIQGYEGHATMLPSLAERQEKASAAMRLLTHTADLIRAQGLTVEMVAGGGTGTYDISGDYPGVTDIEAGSYATMDARYASVGVGFEQALSLLCTIISRPRPDVLIADAGLKAITTEFGMPLVGNVRGATLSKLSEEHAKVVLDDPSQVALAPGDILELIPSHGCTTINLHEEYVICRGGRVESLWPIEARGKCA